MAARAMGITAKYTWTDGTSGITVSNAECRRWQGTFGGQLFRDTPADFIMTRHSLSINHAQGIIEFYKDAAAATPPIPNGTPSGIITLTSDTGNTYAFKALLYNLQGPFASATAGEPQFFRYNYVSNAENTTDTITVT